MAGDIRKNRVSQEIQRFVGNLMISEYGGSDLSMITIHRVKVTQDLRQAKIYYTYFSGKNVQTMQGLLDKESKQIRFKLAERLKHLKFIPEIVFVYDRTADEVMRVEQILGEIRFEGSENEEE